MTSYMLQYTHLSIHKGKFNEEKSDKTRRLLSRLDVDVSELSQVPFYVLHLKIAFMLLVSLVPVDVVVCLVN